VTYGQCLTRRELTIVGRLVSFPRHLRPIYDETTPVILVEYVKVKGPPLALFERLDKRGAVLCGRYPEKRTRWKAAALFKRQVFGSHARLITAGKDGEQPAKQGSFVLGNGCNEF
jgi:hypothetical protein